MGISRILLLFAIAISMAIFVVWEKNKIVESGYQVARLQKSCAETVEKNRKLGYHVARLTSSEFIVYKIRLLKLPLSPEGETSDLMLTGQEKMKGNVAKPANGVLNKGLYTQKEPMVNCCSLHN